MAKKRITVTQEDESGRNQKYHDNKTGEDMTRLQFVKEIKKGNYEDYHIRRINEIDTPVSNPDSTEKNNLD